MHSAPRSGRVLLCLLGALCAGLAAGCAADRPASRTAQHDCPDAPGIETLKTRGTQPNFPEAIDDHEFSRSIEREGGAMCDAGRAFSVAALAEYLDRTECEAVLPEPRRHRFSTEELYEARKPSVLALAEISKCDKCPLWHTRASGTAFVITEDGLCATNHHMFDDKKDDVFVFVATADGAVFPVVEVLAANRDDDTAILKLGRGRRAGEDLDIADAGLTPIPLSDGSPVGTPVALIAHPKGAFFTLTTGIISRRTLHAGGLDGKGDRHTLSPVLCVTCEFGMGSSGGPIMDMAGNALGMVVSTVNIYGEPGRQRSPQMVIRNCAPAASIRSLVRPPVHREPPL